MLKAEAYAIYQSLRGCPFCGEQLEASVRGPGDRARNPKARCKTDGCYGARLPVLCLDIPEDVAAFNRRPEGFSPQLPMTNEIDFREHAEFHESEIDGLGRHVFTDVALQQFTQAVIKAHSSRLLKALDGMDRGCRDPGFRGHENGHGQPVGDELQDAREELAALVGHTPSVDA